MNKSTMMMLLGSKPREERRRRVGVEYEDWAPTDHYGPYMPTTHDLPNPPMSYYDERIHSAYPMREPESAFYDRQGRRHYDSGRYTPMSAYGEPESRRYSDGRFAPRSDYNDPWMDHRMTPTYDDRGERRMNPIGFARDMGGSDATVPHYHEMDRMQGPRSIQGYSDSQYIPQFDRQMAEEWTAGMENADGTRGPHWTLEQTKQVMAQKEIGGSPLEFWVALNATYSDLCKMFKKYGINTVDAYVDFAKSFWLEDKDAIPDKLAAYFTHVVKH